MVKHTTAYLAQQALKKTYKDAIIGGSTKEQAMKLSRRSWLQVFIDSGENVNIIDWGFTE